jgi:hypothetical protein
MDAAEDGKALYTLAVYEEQIRAFLLMKAIPEDAVCKDGEYERHATSP